MALQDRLTVVIDFVTGPAQSGLGKLRNEVRQAEGAMGKMKAGAGALGGMLATNVAGAAVAAAGAIVTFGVKSVKAFQDTALAAGRFADATGVSVESASRLIEVSGDLGISADSVQSAIQRMNVAIDKNGPAIKGMADSIVRAKDGTVDSAASFQNLVTRIGAIPDATERARVAQEVFGRGYAEMAEMMNMSAGQLKASLAGVSDQQVIDESELAKARKFRDSLDALSDKVNGLMMDMGESLLPVVTDVTDAIVNMADKFGELNDAFEGVVGSGIIDVLSPMDNIAQGLAQTFGDNVSAVDRLKGGVSALTGIIPILGEKVSEWADASSNANLTFEHGTEQAREMARIYGERVPPAIEESNVAIFKFRDATADAEAKARDLETQWAYLFGTLDSEKALLNLQEQFDNLYEAGVTAYAAGVEGSDNAAEAQKRHQQAIIDTKIEVAKYGQEVLGLPPDKVTKILAEIDAGNLDRVRNQLEILSRNRTVSLNIIAKGGIGYGGVVGKGGQIIAGATGGIVNRPTMALIGEAGPEAVIPLEKSPGNRPLPTGGAVAASSAPMVVNITTGADPESVVQAIERYRRRNGSLPF